MKQYAKPDFKAIIAVNDAQDIFVLQSNQACEDANLWADGRDYSDNSITLFGASKGFNTGAYVVKLEPWSDHGNGEYDFGIDATIVETLFERDV